MERRIGRKKYKIYALDIETHNDTESIKKQETSMWLGCLIDDNSKIDEESSYFYNMNELLCRLQELSNPKRKHGEKKKPCKNICVYIYNLSFEWSFILPYMYQWGFKYSDKFDNEEMVFNSITTKSVSSVWQVQMKFSSKSGIVILRDLAKIYGGGLGKVAKAFNLPTQKGEIDYRLNRLHGHIVTQEEKEYCFKDTRIIVDILLEMNRRDDKYFWKSMSMASYSMRMMLEWGFPRSFKPYGEYRKLYPELDEIESTFLRHSVGGGITYAPDKWQFKEINQKICHIDAHSMHPSSAYIHQFPYGFGEYGEGKPTNYVKYINCCHIRVSYDDVKLHSIIKLIGIPAVEDFELWVWDFEIETMKKCYVNLEIEYIDYYRYSYKPLAWKKYYAWCYNQRKIAKKNNDNFNLLYFKLLMNSSYGKALEKGHNVLYENYIRDDGIIDSKIIEKPSICLNAKYTYLPYGSCIPAYSRVALIELALKIGYQYVVYFDTDSIFFIWNEETKNAWKKYANKEDFLGGWAVEEFIDKAQFTAPKRYKTESNGKATFKMGGFNLVNYIKTKAQEQNIDEKDVIVPFEEINIVSSKWKVQRAFRCKGGTLIDFQDKEIKVPKKYIDIYEKNKLEY